ncbi:hypothetical protein AALA52_06630, partial [Lactococcus ileimucosae]
AFALSVADVVRLSGPGRAFPNRVGRVGANNTLWWTRTLSSQGLTLDTGWIVSRGDHIGWLASHWTTNLAGHGGMRPALIINPAN